MLIIASREHSNQSQSFFIPLQFRRRRFVYAMSSIEMNDNANGEMSSESKPNEYVSALVKEKYSLDASSHINTMKLIDDG